MFDTVRFDFPLPGKPVPSSVSNNLQTKDMRCGLDEYLVTKDGVLTDDQGELFYWTGFMDLIGCSEYIDSGPNEIWADYRAEFRGGYLFDIKQTSFDRHPALWYAHRLVSDTPEPSDAPTPRQVPAIGEILTEETL